MSETKYIFGEFDYKAKGGKLTLSGYMSTNDVDYAGDICPAESWVENLDIYKNNPIYCFQHDRQLPIGKCNNPYVDSKGLVFDKVELTEYPFVKDVLIPLIEDKVLRQQSVGFLSLDQQNDPKTGLTYHNKNLILEGSLVSVAMNRHCSTEIKTIDGYEQYDSIMKLMSDYNAGRIVPRPTQFAVPTSYMQDNKNLEATEIGQNNDTIMSNNRFTVLAHNDTCYDPSGDVVAKPTKKDANYDEVSSNTYLLKSTKEDGTVSYVYEVASPTENGYRYDFEKVAVVICRVLGARGGDKLESEERSAALERLSEIYSFLDKEFPVYKISISKSVTPETLDFKSISFVEGEPDIFTRSVLVNNLNEIKSALKSVGNDIPEPALEVLKDIYGSVSVSMYAYLWDSDDVEFLSGIIQQVSQYASRDESEDSVYLGFVKFLDKTSTVYGKIKSADGESLEVQVYTDKSGKWEPTDQILNVDKSKTYEITSLDKYNFLLDMHNRISGEFEKAVSTLEKLDSNISDIAKAFFDMEF